ESIVIVKKFELEILTNLHVLDLPESEKHNFGIMSVCLSVCEHDNSKSIIATRLKLGCCFLLLLARNISDDALLEIHPGVGVGGGAGGDHLPRLRLLHGLQIRA
ncbi:unnamed protein product, partial [Larinioides sclopetarius]